MASISRVAAPPFPRSRCRILLLGAALVVAAGVTGCKGKPTVEGRIDENRPEIVAYIQKVSAVRKHLSSAPAEERGFSAASPRVTPANTVVVAEDDFDLLRTDTQSDRNDHADWQKSSTARPWSSVDLGNLVDDVRALPINPPETGAASIAVVDRALAMMRATAYVGGVRTKTAKSATASAGLFTGGAWTGSVLVWSLAKSAWVGAAAVEVSDLRAREKVAGSNASHQLNLRFNHQIQATIRSVLETGAGTKGSLGGAGK